MDTLSSWIETIRFLVLGQVKVPGFGTSCTKHHGDLRFAEEQGVLAKGVLPVWKLVRNCIEDKDVAQNSRVVMRR